MSTVNFNDSTPAAPAGTVNIKFQSDASGNMSGYSPIGTWTSYTPTITGGGSMTISGVSITVAEYLRQGPICSVRFFVSFTAGGTPATSVTMSLPVASTVTQGSYVTLTGWGTTGAGVTIPLVGALGAALQIFAGGNDTTNFALASSSVSGQFFYKCG